MKTNSQEVSTLVSMKKDGNAILSNHILGFLKQFNSDAACKEHIIQAVWNGKPSCPHCGCRNVYRYKNYDRFKCADCKKQFSCLKGTIFENSKMPLQKWFLAIFLFSSNKKGTSSYQLAKDLDITQKSAWFLLHRIRAVFKDREKIRFFGTVELDETYVGGKNKNRHFDKKVKNSQGRSYKDKTPVFGMLQRGGKVSACVVKDVTAKTIKPIVVKNVKRNSYLMTDEWKAYNGLGKTYIHSIVEHGKGQYVNGDCYTNNLEGFWSHLKRGIYGIYHNVTRRHMQRYLDEFVFKYNTRGEASGQRFTSVLQNCTVYLSYASLTSKT